MTKSARCVSMLARWHLVCVSEWSHTTVASLWTPFIITVTTVTAPPDWRLISGKRGVETPPTSGTRKLFTKVSHSLPDEMSADYVLVHIWNHLVLCVCVCVMSVLLGRSVREETAQSPELRPLRWQSLILEINVRNAATLLLSSEIKPFTNDDTLWYLVIYSWVLFDIKLAFLLAIAHTNS